MDLIHKISDDELSEILRIARTFIEWGIEPKYAQLNALVESIKKSMVYFMNYREDEINSVNDAAQATIIIDTFNNLPHPLKDGLIAIREIYKVIESDGAQFSPLTIHNAIRDYLLTIKPAYLEEKLDTYKTGQRIKRGNRRTWKGLTKKEITERNNKIIEAFRKTKLTRNSFAERQAKKHGLSLTQVKNILKHFK
jgi:hypothetical protein